MFVVTMDGITHVIVSYETDLIEESGSTFCGMRFSLWDGINDRAPIPTFRDLPVEHGHVIIPEGVVRCEKCQGLGTIEECGGCQKLLDRVTDPS